MKYEARQSDNSFLYWVRELEGVMSNDQLSSSLSRRDLKEYRLRLDVVLYCRMLLPVFSRRVSCFNTYHSVSCNRITFWSSSLDALWLKYVQGSLCTKNHRCGFYSCWTTALLCLLTFNLRCSVSPVNQAECRCILKVNVLRSMFGDINDLKK